MKYRNKPQCRWILYQLCTMDFQGHYITLRYITTFLSWDTGNISDSKSWKFNHKGYRKLSQSYSFLL